MFGTDSTILLATVLGQKHGKNRVTLAPDVGSGRNASFSQDSWGPIGATYLERLTAVENVAILPAGKALAKYAIPVR